MDFCEGFCGGVSFILHLLGYLTHLKVILSLILGLILAWYIYYRFFKSARVSLTYDHNPLNDFIVENTPEFSKVYSSTPYLITGDAQTLFFEFKRRLMYCPFNIKYDRQLIKFSDGVINLEDYIFILNHF